MGFQSHLIPLAKALSAKIDRRPGNENRENVFWSSYSLPGPLRLKSDFVNAKMTVINGNAVRIIGFS